MYGPLRVARSACAAPRPRRAPGRRRRPAAAARRRRPRPACGARRRTRRRRTRRRRRPAPASSSASAPRSASSLEVSRGSNRMFSSSTTSPAASARPRGPSAELGQRDRGAEQLAEPRGHRGQRVLGSGPPFGRPRCATTTTLAPASAQRRRGRHRGPDAAVVGDPVAVQRHVQVRADQHRPPGDALGDQVVECLHVGRPHSLRGDERGDVDEPVGVAPLVVVPADDLDLVADDLGQARRRRCTTRGSVTMSEDTIGSSV